MKEKLLFIILILSFIPASLMAVMTYYSKEEKEKMSDWVGTGTVKKTELIKNIDEKPTPYSVWKATFLVHEIIKKDKNQTKNEDCIEFYYYGDYKDENKWVILNCPPRPSVKIGDKAKLYLEKDDERGIPGAYYLPGYSFFMKVRFLDKLPDTLPGEESYDVRDRNIRNREWSNRIFDNVAKGINVVKIAFLGDFPLFWFTEVELDIYPEWRILTYLYLNDGPKIPLLYRASD